MTDAPGPLIASGRAADVYDVGHGKVLRRYRVPNAGLADEMRVMRAVADAGLRVPRVYDLEPDHDATRDLLMDRIDGVTMLDELERKPWKIIRFARMLARIQEQINQVAAPQWMTPPTGPIVPGGDSVLHMDMHPMNVMLGSDGPVVIDWTNAVGGPPGFDAAMSYVLMATFEATDTKERVAQWVLTRSFRRARGARELDAFVAAACDHRLADRNVTPAERLAVAALRARHA